MSAHTVRRAGLAVLLLLFIAAPAAVADTQQGSMSGTVVDKGNVPLPGVTVVVKGPALQGERSAITDAEGKFRIPMVPVGKSYEVTAFLDGFQKFVQTDIDVGIGANARVDFTLAEGTGDLGEITVTATPPLLDAKKTSVSQTITKEFMEELPTGRTYFDAMIMAAGVAGYGNVHTHGAEDSDNVFLIDGVDTTDNATGTFGMNFSYEAIQEVEMKTGAFEAEYGRATGAISNVVTKSGGNEFHGSVPLFYTNLDMKRHQAADRGAVDEEDFYEIEPGAFVGGPVLRDKLWFFASYNRFVRRITGINDFDEAIKRSEMFEEYMGKLTWQLNPNNKIVGQVAGDPAIIDSRDSLDPDIQASAYDQQEQGGNLYKLEWTSIFTPNLFLEAKIAHHEANLTIGPANAAPLDDRFTDQRNGEGSAIIYGNTTSTTDISRPRDQFSTVLNFYRGDWAGEHNFKFGAEYQDFEYSEDAFYPNSYVINRPGGLPDQWYRQSPLLSFNDGEILTAFVQDAWTWRDNWNFNLGVRWETQTQNNDVGERVYKLDNLLAPRLGASWDVRGDGRSKAYFNYGRYFDAVGTYLGQALNRNGNESWYYEGDYETGQWDEITHTTPDGNATRVDPNLDASFKDEIIAGYEFEFATDFTAGAKVVYNWQDNLIEDVVGNEAEVRSGQTDDFWYYVTNIPSAKRTYRGIELEMKKRLSNNYQFLLVYTLSEAKGSVALDGNEVEGLSVYGDIAETYYNRYGYLPWDDRHYLKLNGSYHLPWGVIVGTGIGWRSGRPYNRIGSIAQWKFDDNQSDAFNSFGSDVYLDPRGSHRLDPVWWLDLRLSKDFNLGPTELSVIVDAFNVINNQAILHRREEWSRGPGQGDDPNWGTPDAWQAAGNFTVGLKYTF